MRGDRGIPFAQAHEAATRAATLLARRRDVRLVYVYGSGAEPGRRTARDVDLVLLTDRALTLDELVRLRAELGRVVPVDLDLVSLNDASIVLAHEVVESWRCLYARAPELETEFVTRTRARYWDFQPFRVEQWRLLGERLDERAVVRRPDAVRVAEHLGRAPADFSDFARAVRQWLERTTAG
jgi:predicted nucleotidyltransferase